jgi:hypothetical protein
MRGVSSQKPSGMPGEANRQRPSRHLPNPGKVNGYPFSDGNGRTARTLAYMILCLKLGYILPGSPTIPAQIDEDKSHYIEALEKSDEAFKSGVIDMNEMELMLKGMLARQLIGVIDAADGITPQISN